MKDKQSFEVIGLMSGTSLDGIDLAHTVFKKQNDSWLFELRKALTVPHSELILPHLENLAYADDSTLEHLDKEFGQYIGQAILDHFDLTHTDFIASHGHTAKHNPAEGYSIQIGSGGIISQITGKPVVNNFRAKDVSLGGQGAPLVPIGDRDLFHQYDYCLNLGGIANISFEEQGRRLAYDICPFNMALNEISSALGKPYDDGGEIAQSGTLDKELLEELNSISYYSAPFPKSLAYEDYSELWRPLLKNSNTSGINLLRTLIEHFSDQISLACGGTEAEGSLIITGGGTYNSFFVKTLRRKLPKMHIQIPDKDIIEFKEAIVFAYLGLLRVLELPNALASVTGASCDSSGGDLHGF